MNYGCVSIFSMCWWNSLTDTRNTLVASICGQRIMCLLLSIYVSHLGHIALSQSFQWYMWLPYDNNPLTWFLAHMLWAVEYYLRAFLIAFQFRWSVYDGWTHYFFNICKFRASPWMWLYMALLIFLLIVVFLIISCHWLMYKVECDGDGGMSRLSRWWFVPKSNLQFRISHWTSLIPLCYLWPLI